MAKKKEEKTKTKTNKEEIIITADKTTIKTIIAVIQNHVNMENVLIENKEDI